jgi:hypothetical protein
MQFTSSDAAQPQTSRQRVRAFFLESVPVKDPARVVSLYSNAQSRKGPPQEYLATPYPNAVDYREKIDVFSGCSNRSGTLCERM